MNRRQRCGVFLLGVAIVVGAFGSPDQGRADHGSWSWPKGPNGVARVEVVDHTRTGPCGRRLRRAISELNAVAPRDLRLSLVEGGSLGTEACGDRAKQPGRIVVCEDDLGSYAVTRVWTGRTAAIDQAVLEWTRLTIDTGLSGKDQRLTFCHELGHAIGLYQHHRDLRESCVTNSSNDDLRADPGPKDVSAIRRLYAYPAPTIDADPTISDVAAQPATE